MNETNGTSALTEREEFGGRQIAHRREVGAEAALAAQARAEVEARFIMAIQRPRDLDLTRARLLKDSRRPGFADAAIFAVPRGRKLDPKTQQWVDNIVEGPSVRFAEAAAGALGNLETTSTVLYDDAEMRKVRVTTTDLEANVTFSSEFVLSKTVERSKLRKGQTALTTRVNSSGQAVYVVAATDDELTQKQNALQSKALRNNVMRLLPADIREEALEQCRKTAADRAAKDPDAEKKRVVDAFASVGVLPDQLRAYLGHGLETVSPAELADLRAVFSSLRDGETTWADLIEGREPAPVASSDLSAGTASPPAPAPASRSAQLAAKLKKEAPPAPVATPAQVQAEAREEPGSDG